MERGKPQFAKFTLERKAMSQRTLGNSLGVISVASSASSCDGLKKIY